MYCDCNLKDFLISNNCASFFLWKLDFNIGMKVWKKQKKSLFLLGLSIFFIPFMYSQKIELFRCFPIPKKKELILIDYQYYIHLIIYIVKSIFSACYSTILALHITRFELLAIVIFWKKESAFFDSMI